MNGLQFGTSTYGPARMHRQFHSFHSHERNVFPHVKTMIKGIRRIDIQHGIFKPNRISSISHNICESLIFYLFK